MSRTRHHSRKWSGHHKLATSENKRRAGTYRNIYNGCHDASEACPSGWNSLMVIRPMRRADKLVIKKFITGEVEPDAAVMPYLGTRGQHEWYW